MQDSAPGPVCTGLLVAEGGFCWDHGEAPHLNIELCVFRVCECSLEPVLCEPPWACLREMSGLSVCSRMYSWLGRVTVSQSARSGHGCAGLAGLGVARVLACAWKRVAVAGREGAAPHPLASLRGWRSSIYPAGRSLGRPGESPPPPPE